jgi:Fur family peroxide stress response transcriptional regulator
MIRRAAAGPAAELHAALRAAGLRMTPQRLAVYRFLVGRRGHPTAHEVYERLLPAFPSLSRATVYNTLQTLAHRGLVVDLGAAGDGAAHFDGDRSPHAHLVCTQCHAIDDFADRALAALPVRAARRSGYVVRGARLVYYGLCPRCRRRRST